MAIKRKPFPDDDFDVHDVNDSGLSTRTRVASADTIQVPHGFAADPSFGEGVALVSGHSQSLSGEIRDLRRDRLCAAAMFLSLVYVLLFFWNWLTRHEDFWFIWATMGLRFVLAAAASGLLLSRVALTSAQVRVIEFSLFGGLIAILALSQYLGVSELLRRDDVPAAIAFIKNGVIQVFALMGLYGTFIPNGLRSAAGMVVAMATAPIVAIALATSRPEFAEAVSRLHNSERIGTNVLFLSIGAALAIYSAHILGGLRAELHEARRFGHYRLLRRIGAGGMGEVYLAEHRLLKRPCAMKLIKAGSGREPLALARFEREVQAAAQLSHPNTIEIYDYGRTEDGTFYYVMEFLNGLTLADLVAKNGPISRAARITCCDRFVAGSPRRITWESCIAT